MVNQTELDREMDAATASAPANSPATNHESGDPEGGASFGEILSQFEQSHREPPEVAPKAAKALSSGSPAKLSSSTLAIRRRATSGREVRDKAANSA